MSSLNNKMSDHLQPQGLKGASNTITPELSRPTKNMQDVRKCTGGEEGEVTFTREV